ncbi:hypothetical protein [Xanthobacter sp. ZOL 2024]
MNEDLNITIHVGTILIIETGEYSDKMWQGPVRVTRAFRKRVVADAYRAAWKPDPTSPWIEEPDPDGFLPWLVKEKYVEDISSVAAWHVGSYSRFEP